MWSLGRKLQKRHLGGRVRVAPCLAALAAGIAGLPAWGALGGAWTTAPAWAGTVTVGRGQTLTQIAAQLHTSVAALVAANGLTDPNRVLAGQLLEIPGNAGGVAPGTAVVVQPGQTLSAIAGRYGVSVAALAAANRLGDPNRLLAGTQLLIPGGAGTPSAPVAATGATVPRTVVVGRGQTLTAIAASNGVSVAALAAANKINNPNRVLAGTRLVIPGTAGSGMALASYTVPIPSRGGLPGQLAANPGRLSLQPAFASAAARYGVPVALLEALCWWESGWQSAIVSPTGAIGVCQIEPYTASFVDRYLTGAALDPHVAEQNIQIGAAFLSSLLRATNGDVGQAVAGYYQGLTSVRQHGMLPATTTYVRGIEAYAAIFAG